MFVHWGEVLESYCTVSVALLVVERYVARMVADVPCTMLVVTGKVTLVAPAGMMAVDGT
jgi:hypothetical protein